MSELSSNNSPHLAPASLDPPGADPPSATQRLETFLSLLDEIFPESHAPYTLLDAANILHTDTEELYQSWRALKRRYGRGLKTQLSNIQPIDRGRPRLWEAPAMRHIARNWLRMHHANDALEYLRSCVSLQSTKEKNGR